MLESKTFFDTIAKAQFNCFNHSSSKEAIRSLTNEAIKVNCFCSFYYGTMGHLIWLDAICSLNKHAPPSWVADKRAQIEKKEPGKTLRPLISLRSRVLGEAF